MQTPQNNRTRNQIKFGFFTPTNLSSSSLKGFSGLAVQQGDPTKLIDINTKYENTKLAPKPPKPPAIRRLTGNTTTNIQQPPTAPNSPQSSLFQSVPSLFKSQSSVKFTLKKTKVSEALKSTVQPVKPHGDKIKFSFKPQRLRIIEKPI